MNKKLAILISQDPTLKLQLDSQLAPLCNTLSFTSFEEAFHFMESVSNAIQIIFIDDALQNFNPKQYLSQIHTISFVPEVVVLLHEKSNQQYRDYLKMGIFDCIAIHPNGTLDTELKSITQKALHFSSAVRKLNLYLTYTFLESFNNQILLAKELADQKNAKGESLTDNDLLAFFSPSQLKTPVVQESLKQFDVLRHFQHSNGATVLAVDDEPEVRRVVQDFLLTRKLKPLMAKNGEEALKLVKLNPNIQLLILDIGLPDMTGFELRDKLMEIVPEAEVVMLTGFDDIEKVRLSFSKQVFDYVVKPYHSTEFSNVIFKALQRYFLKKVIQTHSLTHNTPKTIKDRLKLLQDLATKRLEGGLHLYMEDVYCFFPELKKCGLDPKKMVSKDKIQNGLIYFIESLDHEVNSVR